MVQLKSFKYLEAGASSNVEAEPGRPKEESSSPAASSSSEVSIASSIVGGNLTRSGTSTTIGHSLATQNNSNKLTNVRIEPTVKTSKEVLTLTLTKDEKALTSSSSSSSGEYRETKLNIVEDDEEEENNIDSADTGRVGIGDGRDALTPVEPVATTITTNYTATIPVTAAASVSNQLQQPRKQQQLAKSPLIQKAPLSSVSIGRQHAGSPNLLINRLAQSPQQRQFMGGSPIGRRLDGQSDTLSQYSFNQRNGGAFEVRWRNIYLMASKSRVPKFIAENPIYKLFKAGRSSSNSAAGDGVAGAGSGCSEEELQEKVYYSSPVLRAGLRSTMAMATVPSIDEDLPLSISLGKNQQQQVGGGANLAAQAIAPELFDSSNYKPILSNISGSVLSGQLTAILGPSGVGKTSLLKALTGRNTLQGIGRVNLLGETGKRMQVVNVPQDDVLPDKLTVEEDLNFTSRLKNVQKGFDHARNIRRIVRLLQLDQFTQTRIDKLSGGQCRRLSIARELLSSPDIVILDEPTSGLDANTCRKIIIALRDLAENGGAMMGRPMSIIVTIHQPQIEVYNLFHRVYVMAVGGRAIYEGTPSNLLPTLVERSSLREVCAVDQLNDNPAVVAIEVASGEYGQNIINELAVHQEQQSYEEHCESPFSTPRSRAPSKSPLSVSPRFELLHRAQMNSSSAMSAEQSNSSPFFGRPIPNIGRRAQSADRISAVTTVSYNSIYDNDLPEQASRHLKVDKRLRRSVVMRGDLFAHISVLIRRSLLLTTRNMFLMAIRIIGFTLVALGMVQTFAHHLDRNEHICPNYQTEVDDIIDYMEFTRERLLNLKYTLEQTSAAHMFFFHLILSITMVTSAIAGLTFPYRMRMFLREQNNGWYSTGTFILSHTLAEIPIDIVGPLIVVLITYPLCNQPQSEYYWREIGYTLVLIATCALTKSQAEIASAFLIDSVEHSVFVSCVLVAPPTLMSGITIKIPSLPPWLQVISYGSFLRYGFEGLMGLRFGYGMCPCDPELIHGYPSKISTDAMPAQLDNLARGLFELNSPGINETLTTNGPALATATTTNETMALAATGVTSDQSENIFHSLVRLLSDSSNLFILKPERLGQCDGYTSLILLDKGIEDRIVLRWLLTMVFMFVVMRVLLYLAVKTVIKTRR